MKTSAFAIAAIVVAGLASPVLAASSNYATDSSFDADFVLTRLQGKGVDAIAAYPNGADRVRAIVKLSNGTEVFQYFDQDTLAPVTGAANVLTSLDTAQ